MFCSNCGAKNAEGSDFCTSCGNPLAGNERPDSPPAPATGTTSNAAPPTAAPARPRFWIPTLVSASVCLGFHVLQFLVLMMQSHGEAREIAPLWNVLRGVLWIPLLAFGGILHYGCWKCLPARHARLTPGKAVGFLFIPLFQLYWAFPSFAGLGRGFRKLAEERGSAGYSSLPALGASVAAVYAVQTVYGMLFSFCTSFWAARATNWLSRWDIERQLGFLTKIDTFVGLCFSIALFVVGLLFYRLIRRLTSETDPR